MVSDPQLLYLLKRCVTQQNKVTNKSFIQSSDERLQFFCGNDTQVTWNAVQEKLIDMLNSNIYIQI